MMTESKFLHGLMSSPLLELDIDALHAPASIALPGSSSLARYSKLYLSTEKVLKFNTMLGVYIKEFEWHWLLAILLRAWKAGPPVKLIFCLGNANPGEKL